MSENPEQKPQTTEAQKQPKIIAIGSGKGGVGKSLLTANLGIFLAQLGHRVLLIDADLDGANLHTFLGIERPRVTLADFFDKRVAHVKDCMVETLIPGMGLISGQSDPLWNMNPRATSRGRFLHQLRELDFDYVLCDLASGAGFTALDLFLAAHIGLLLVVPEPTSIENTYRFLQNAFFRQLADVRSLQSLVTDRAPDGPRTPLEFYERLVAANSPLAPELLHEIRAFRPRLIVNQTQSRSDADLGLLLRSMARRILGLPIEYLGHLDSEEVVTQAVRKRRPLVIESPESKTAKNIERLARKLMGIDVAAAEKFVPQPTEKQTLYQILEADPGASEADLRRAHKRMRDLYSADSLAPVGLVQDGDVEEFRQGVDQAFDLLLDPEKRHAYDLELQSTQAPAKSEKKSSKITPAVKAPPPPREAPAASEPAISTDTEFTGALLKQLREARGIELHELSHRTKVGVKHFRSIEEETFQTMPATVYVRGFLVEYARFFRLNVDQVTRTYLARMNR